MEQLKVILKHLQKYHFWLLCVVVMIAGVVGWSMARKALSMAYDTKKASIVGKFNAISEIARAENPPNATWATEANKLTEEEQKQVTSTWTKVYEEQKKHLIWPQALGERFLKFVNENPEHANIPEDLRGIYQTQIKEVMSELLKVVDAERPENADVKTSENEPRVPKVVWDINNQNAIASLIDWQETPSARAVRQAQEDLWVCRLLLSIIRDVNQGAIGPPPVRRISELTMGKAAMDEFREGMKPGRIEKAPNAPPGGGGGGGEGPPPVAPGTPIEGEEAPAPGAEGQAPPTQFANNRYVDATGKPLPGADVAKLQFKRLPVFMRLTLDQTAIAKLLVRCANSPLPIEVNQFRVNTGAASSSSSSSGSAAPSAPRSGGGGGGGSLRGNSGGNMRAGAGAGGASGGAAASSEGPATETESQTVTVDLCAIVYLYNPPNSGEVTIEQQPGGGAGAAPAAAPDAGGSKKKKSWGRKKS